MTDAGLMSDDTKSKIVNYNGEKKLIRVSKPTNATCSPPISRSPSFGQIVITVNFNSFCFVLKLTGLRLSSQRAGSKNFRGGGPLFNGHNYPQ